MTLSNMQPYFERPFCLLATQQVIQPKKISSGCYHFFRAKDLFILIVTSDKGHIMGSFVGRGNQ